MNMGRIVDKVSSPQKQTGKEHTVLKTDNMEAF
jgi:hypothetical protein